MGADIHGWVEQKHNGKWIAIKELGRNASDRNYERFAALAGVRDYNETSSSRPYGIPDDISETAKLDIDKWDIDGHSHSYLGIEKAAKIFFDTRKNKDKEIYDPIYHYFDLDLDIDDDLDNFRVVFWFDN